MKSKSVLAIMLVLMFATAIPIVTSDVSENPTLYINLPPGHEGHLPAQTITGICDDDIWVNVNTLAAPSWVKLPPDNPAGPSPLTYANLPTIVDPNLGRVLDVKVPEIWYDDLANGKGHRWGLDGYTVDSPGVLIFSRSQANSTDHHCPTRRFLIDPESVTINLARKGPKIDVMRAKVVKNPDAQLIAMQTEEGVILTDLIRTGDIEKLDSDGFTITSAPGFHMGHIGYNLRPDRSYLTPPIKCNPLAAPVLSDVNFRHAMFHLYNQEEIVSSVYGYIVTDVQSLVPPSQGGWVNPDVPLHPFNPGSLTATTVYNPDTGEHEDACSILRYGGYVYDSGRDNWAAPFDIDGDTTPGETNGDDDIPGMQLWTPTYEVAPTSAEHGARFIADCNDYGITSIAHVPREFSPYMDDVDIGDFDLYMVFWSLGRFPDHLYTMCHSDHDVAKIPADYNKPGCNDPDLDEAVFTVYSSLDHSEKLAAAHEAQRILYDEAYPGAAFSYMQLYSRIYFNAFNPDLRGIVNSPGYGSNNGWTLSNLHWEPGLERLTPEGKTIIEWLWGEEPELLNPCWSSTVYAWDIINPTLDGLLAVNPYTHEDMGWQARDWGIQKWATEDDVTELLLNYVTVTNESLGFGDGATTVFELENTDVTPASETVYLNNTAQTILVDYTMDYAAGEITFTTAPSATTWINADYTYNYLVGSDRVGSHWHEDWPRWSTNWYMQDWTDNLPVGFGDNDIVEFTDDDYVILDMTWDIKVERMVEPYDEMKLSGTDAGLARPPTDIAAGAMVGSTWHEEYPVRSNTYTVTAFTDNTDGILSRSDELVFDGGDEWHVDSVTVTLHMDVIDPIPDGEIDKVIEFAGTGMKVWFILREDVFWQDGNAYKAADAVFSWLFLRDNEIPRYAGMWQFLEDATAVTDYKVVAYMNTTSQFLIYDLAGTAALLPPPVWEPLDGQPLTTIVSYDPANSHDRLPGMGSWFNPTPGLGNDQGLPETHLYGTGLFVFEYYDPDLLVSDLHQFIGYFKSVDDFDDMKTEMFHRIGDVNRDGYIDVFDLSRVGIAYGKRLGQPGYDADADLNEDGRVEARDLAFVAFHWGEQKEYP